MRTPVRLGMAATLIAGMATVVGVVPTAHAASGTARARLPIDVDIRIRLLHSGKCLDVQEQSTLNGAAIVQRDCSGQSSQRFRIVNATGTFRIRTFAGKCLTVNGAGDDNAKVVQDDCTGRPGQVVNLVGSAGKAGTELRVNGYLKCLAVQPAGNAPLAPVACGSGLNNDRFLFEKI
ncbi:RICIN domain-containing protein [Rhizohabitans arisaemae]|uniref:RICIN domain-containing protein n=1 Tax=Rhizohabitans arisaemae TaxID=2720610 RepID=UPI0024B0ADF1|nr:RICIN domain-containing protein [Rhizohabitans arisaemae]